MRGKRTDTYYVYDAYTDELVGCGSLSKISELFEITPRILKKYAENGNLYASRIADNLLKFKRGGTTEPKPDKASTPVMPARKYGESKAGIWFFAIFSSLSAGIPSPTTLNAPAMPACKETSGLSFSPAKRQISKPPMYILSETIYNGCLIPTEKDHSSSEL